MKKIIEKYFNCFLAFVYTIWLNEWNIEFSLQMILFATDALLFFMNLDYINA